MERPDVCGRGRFVEASPTELAEGLQQLVARLVDVDDLHHRSVDEGEQYVGRIVIGRTDRLDCGEVEAASEDRQAGE